MSKNLMTANRQWATRPNDERFSTLEEMYQKAVDIRDNSEDRVINIKELECVPTEDDGLTINYNGESLNPTNYAFESLCRRIDFPAKPLSKLSAELAANVVNFRIDQMNDDEMVMISNHRNSVRAMTSERYTRLWQADVIPFLANLRNFGWKVPPSRPAYPDQPGTRVATADDCLDNQDFGLAIKPGDLIAPGALFMGDRDMFATMVNLTHKIDDGSGRKLSRGMFMMNSEVGYSSFKMTEFNMMEVCGNLIMWGAQDIVTISYKHIGDLYDRLNKELENARKRLTQFVPTDLSEAFGRLRTFKIADLKEDVVEKIYKMRITPTLTKKVINAGYDLGLKFGEIDGAAPNTPLGLVHGLTRYSQTLPNADDKLDIDAAAGLVMDEFDAICV